MTIEMKEGEHTEQEVNFIAECNGLMTQAEEYFGAKERQRQDRMVKRDYTKVNSRINTNLAAPNVGAKEQHHQRHRSEAAQEFQGPYEEELEEDEPEMPGSSELMMITGTNSVIKNEAKPPMVMNKRASKGR